MRAIVMMVIIDGISIILIFDGWTIQSCLDHYQDSSCHLHHCHPRHQCALSRCLVSIVHSPYKHNVCPAWWHFQSRTQRTKSPQTEMLRRSYSPPLQSLLPHAQPLYCVWRNWFLKTLNKQTKLIGKFTKLTTNVDIIVLCDIVHCVLNY